MSRIAGTTEGQRFQIKLDWREYFYNFVSEHGEPIEHEGYLLFGDGWRYSPISYQGPEYPPPKDKRELTRLRLAYWTRMEDTYSQEIQMLRNQLQALEDWQATKSLPIQQRTIYQKEGQEGLATMSESRDLDLSTLQERIEDLKALYNQASQHLQELQDER